VRSLSQQRKTEAKARAMNRGIMLGDENPQEEIKETNTFKDHPMAYHKDTTGIIIT